MDRSDIQMESIDGTQVNFSDFDGDYLLAVNVASR